MLGTILISAWTIQIDVIFICFPLPIFREVQVFKLSEIMSKLIIVIIIIQSSSTSSNHHVTAVVPLGVLINSLKLVRVTAV